MKGHLYLEQPTPKGVYPPSKYLFSPMLTLFLIY